MLRCLQLTTAIVIALNSFLLRTAFSFPLFMYAQYPTVPSSEANSLLCYMQTADGRILNLRALCTQSTSSSPRHPSPLAEMPLGDVSYDGNFLTGKVTNLTGQTVNGVTVNYEVLDEAGNQIDAGFFKAQLSSPIPPGEAALFKETIEHPGAKVRTTFVDWKY